jgi:CheY-like chemotaxis protein/signal recognition particle receptor subunit beta
MTNSLVLVADGDPKNLQILKENLEASGFVVITAPNGIKAWEEIQQTPPNLVLTEINLPGLNGYQLLERLQADPNTRNIPLLFLTNQREIQQRVRGFELGAKDYLVKPLHVKEVIAHIRMVLRRLERRKTEQLETYMKFSGRLDQLNLADLIESFGVERKTGVLTISNGRRTGQVYFRDGTVVNAALGNITQEPAIYQMLPWNRGYFNMVFKEIDVPDQISISNLGLLLHGVKRMEIREQLIGQLSSPRTSFMITPTFKMLITRKRVNGEITQFVKLFDGKRDVEQIIDDSGMDDLLALKRIVRLYQQGFIKPTIPPERKPVIAKKIEPDDQEIKFISKPEPKPLKPAPPQKEPAEPKFFDDTGFDVHPMEKQRDLEGEIKPIFERIEQEKKKVVIPDQQKKSEELQQAKEREEPQIPEKVQDAEFELTSKIELEDEDIIRPPEEAFVDEQLIRQPLEIDDREKLEIEEIEEKRPETIHLEDESEPMVEFEPFEPEQKAEQKSVAKPSPEKEMKPTDQAKPGKIEQKIREASPARDSILVISIDDDCKDELMDVLTNDNFTSRHIKELDNLQLDTGKIHIDGFTGYKIFAVSIDKPFNVILESLKQKMCGVIFAVDCSRGDTWEYTSYLIQSIAHKFQLPYVVAVMNFHDQNSITMDVIRYQLHVDETIQLFAWDAVDRSVIRKIMNSVTNFRWDENERYTPNIVDMYVDKVMV